MTMNMVTESDSSRPDRVALLYPRVFYKAFVVAVLSSAHLAIAQPNMTWTFTGGWFSSFFTYTFTVGTTPTMPAGVTLTSMHIDLDNFPVDPGSVTAGGPGTAVFTPGPPRAITLTVSTGLSGTDTITINSGNNPNAVLGKNRPVRYDDSTVAPTVWYAGYLTAFAPPPTGLTVPVVALLAEGSSSISGIAAPGSYVTIFQDDPSFTSGALGSLGLGQAVADGSGSFTVNLARALTYQNVSFGVGTDSLTGQIVQQMTPIPEPATFALLGMGVAFVCIRKRSVLTRKVVNP
jgi:hypothetical protein